MVKLIDWSSLDPTIQQLYSEGKSPNYIAKELGLSRETIVKRMESTLGVVTKRNGPRLSADWVNDSEIRCSVCQIVKPHSEYLKIRKDSQYLYSFCKGCVADKERVRYLSQGVSWTKKIYDLKVSARRRNLDFNLSPDFLSYVFETQKGLCAYTGVKLDHTKGRGLVDNCVSVDRFDPSIGYVVGNILICSKRANSIKQDQTPQEFEDWMPQWYVRGSAALAEINSGWPINDETATVIDIP